MQGLNTKIAAIAGLLLIATALALQFSKTSAPPRESARSSESPNLPATSAASPQTVPAREVSVSSIASQTEGKLAGSAEEIIAKIKNALAHSGSRHTYATFSKLSETVDASNVREVLAFVQTLAKPQE